MKNVGVIVKIRENYVEPLMKKGKVNQHCNETDLYFNDIKKYKPLSREEEAELAVRIKKGDAEAMEKLVKSNLKFVTNYAKQYRNSGVPFSDLISEGNIGLMKAAQKFDETKGVKFISYAVWWVRNSIQECIDTYNGNISEIETIDYNLDSCQEMEYEEGSAIINDEFESKLIDAQSSKVGIDELMKTLKERERKILSLYFGLDDGKGKTLEEIGEKYHMTSERVRQIKDKALVKLKTEALISDEFETYKSLR